MGTQRHAVIYRHEAFEQHAADLADQFTLIPGHRAPDIEKIGAYWTRRAESYSEQIKRNEREGPWGRELTSHFPPGTRSVLDMGTGPGFFAILLARLGFSVTAADYSTGMLERAKANAGDLLASITFVRTDAQSTGFEDCSFDAVVTRNLTWNLHDPERAYMEWHRVLRPGGVLVNFDANWYSYLFDDGKRLAFSKDRDSVRAAGVNDFQDYDDCCTMERIAAALPSGRFDRPKWDTDVLSGIGFIRVSADLTAGDRLWSMEERINNASTPLFCVCGTKRL